MAGPATFRYHGLFSMRVEHRALARSLVDEFSFFLDRDARPDDPVDLVVEEGPVPLPDRMLSTYYSFDRDALVMKTPAGNIRLTEGVLRAESSVNVEELYSRWVEGILFLVVLAKGAFFAHSSAVSKDGVGVLFPAWAHTGKTNIAIDLVRRGYDYMADDWCLVAATGEILGYPRWPNLFSYNFEAHPELVRGVGGPRAQRSLARRLAMIRFAKSLDSSKRFSESLRSRLESRYYVHNRVSLMQAIPGSRLALRAPLTKAYLLSATRTGAVEASPLRPDELARRCALTAMYERVLFNMDRTARAYAAKEDGPLDFTAAGEAVLRRAFGRTRCQELLIPTRPTEDDFHQILVAIESS
jgi:hypothetical protein